MEFVYKLMLVIVTLNILSACSSDDGSKTSDSTFVETGLLLRIVNNNGDQLFESNIIDTNSVKFFYKINNELTLFNSHFGYAQDSNDKPFIGFQCYTNLETNLETTYIKWSTTDIDTLTYTYKKYPNGSEATFNYKYNNHEINADSFGIFTAVKEFSLE